MGTYFRKVEVGELSKLVELIDCQNDEMVKQDVCCWFARTIEIGLKPALKRKPLRVVRVCKDQLTFGRIQLEGRYKKRHQSIIISGKPIFQQSWDQSPLHSVNCGTKSAEEAMEAIFFHELGHHLQWQFLEIASIIDRGYSHTARNCLTNYGLENAKEYFCECLAAYIVCQDLLRVRDPVGLRMIEQALEFLGRPR